MRSEWRTLRLSQLGRIVTGRTPPADCEGCFGGSTLFVTPSDYVGSKYIRHTARALTVRGEQAIAGARVPRNAVMVTCIGSDMGKVALSSADTFTNQQINSLIVENGDLPEYVYYNLLMRKGELRAMASGSAQPILNKSAFGATEINLPSIGVQIAVVEVLRGIDDRIDLSSQTNATLESISKALFKSWFIDFDPVRAKSEGRELEGMDAATAALFPARFEESELGSIPAGWRAGALANLSDLNARTWSARRHPDRIEYIDLGNVKSNVLGETVQYEFNEAPSRARRELRDGDTIVGTVRPGNCSFAFISRARPGLTASTGFAVLSPRLPELAEFIYLAATWRGNIERLASLADGGAYPAVRPELVAATPCVVAPGAILSAFSRIAAPLFEARAAAEGRATTLTALRDTLLPRLISGNLCLPEVHDQFEEALK